MEQHSHTAAPTSLSSVSSAAGKGTACSQCSDTGFRPVKGGVIRCGCLAAHLRSAGPDERARKLAKARPVELRKKRRNHRERILTLLREHGTAGVRNLELYSICLCPPSRICELRKMGYRIETRREGEGVFRYILRGEPNEPKPLPVYASRKVEPKTLSLFDGVQR